MARILYIRFLSSLSCLFAFFVATIQALRLAVERFRLVGLAVSFCSRNLLAWSLEISDNHVTDVDEVQARVAVPALSSAHAAPTRNHTAYCER